MQMEVNKRIVAARDAECILAIVAAEHGVFNAVNAATAFNRLAKTRQSSSRGPRMDDQRVQSLFFFDRYSTVFGPRWPAGCEHVVAMCLCLR